MRLLRLEVWNWRGLDHAAIGELAPDLNLVIGPNESGKSRLFEALRYALFERYKGESEEKKRLRTWGGTESPAVEVHFEAGGSTWKVHKRFLKGASARLEGNGATWVDDDAEGQLHRLWGTREIKGKKDVEQYLGLWPLLWLQQGRAGQAPHADLNDETRARLQDALAVHVQEVASGRLGQRIVERADEERGRYWTATGKERGELLVAKERLEAATLSYERASARREQARAVADELARLEIGLRDAHGKVATQRARVDEARARVGEAHARASALHTRRLETKTLLAERELWHQKRQERAQLEAETALLAKGIAERGAILAKLGEEASALKLRRTSARSRVDEAEANEAAAKELRAIAVRHARRKELEAQARTGRESLGKVSAHHDKLCAIHKELGALKAGPREMKALHHAREAFARANAALTAASARVTLHALTDLVVDGKPLKKETGRELRLDEPTSILIDGIVEIHVSPAGAELYRLRDAERDARQVLEAILVELGVSTAGEAEDQYRRRIELDAERKHLEALLAELGTGGAERLQAAIAAAEAEVTALGGECAETAPVEALERALTDSEEALHVARTERDLVERDLGRIEGEHATLRSLLDDVAARHRAARDRLDALASPERIKEAVAAADAAWATAEAAVDALQKDLQRRGDLDVATDLEREEKAFAQIEASHRSAKERTIDLQASVRHLGAEAIHEEVLQAESELNLARADLERVSRRAGAARALFEALTAAQREVQERLVAPVREKVEPYLQGILPGVELDMDERWTVRGLRAASQTEDFEALSGGAREQVSLLVRLGLAEVLGQGEPLPIVLDDCLVNTDPERQKDMLRILYRASKKQQILLFSCHDVAFERLGATRRYDLPARRAR